jgi:hydrogenase-4 component E
MLQLNPVATSLFSILIIVSLLLNFVMLGSHWLKNYVLAFAAESWIIAGLSVGIGYFSGLEDLYVVGILTLLFRGMILPWLLTRMVNKLEIKRELHSLIPPSSSLILCIVLVVFAFIVSTQLAKQLQLTNNILILALMAMLSIKLIGFLLLAVRDQAISKILALLVLENGIFLGSLFLIPGMPMFIELVILFDLLIVVASFSVLVNYLHTHVGSTSTKELKRLVG